GELLHLRRAELQVGLLGPEARSDTLRDLHALPRGPPPGPPTCVRVDLEHRPGPPDPRVRSAEVRRGPRRPKLLPAARRRDVPREQTPPTLCLRVAPRPPLHPS